jgi:integrase/recombinase XerD
VTLPAPLASRNIAIPAEVQSLGTAAAFAWDEFFSGRLRNPHTRDAYQRAVMRFLDWLAPAGVELPQVTPGMIGRYMDELPLSIPTKKLALAALRAFFDCLVQRHVCILNPAASVRGERYSVVEGATPEITAPQARQLLDSIDGHWPIDLRDRCIIGVLIFTAARAGAVAKLRQRDLLRDSAAWSIRFTEKGGKRREIPVRFDLQEDLQSFLSGAFFGEPVADAPLFPSAAGRTGLVGDTPMTVTDIGRMVKRRLAAAALPSSLSSHSFRVGTITNLLSNGVSLEDTQYLAGHADPRTTRLYDRRARVVTRNVVERITI